MYYLFLKIIKINENIFYCEIIRRNPFVEKYTWPLNSAVKNMQLALSIHSSTSMDSTNLGLCSTVVYISWKKFMYKWTRGTSLAVQWLQLHVSIAGGTGSIPGWGPKIPHAAHCGQKKNGPTQFKPILFKGKL